ALPAARRGRQIRARRDRGADALSEGGRAVGWGKAREARRAGHAWRARFAFARAILSLDYNLTTCFRALIPPTLGRSREASLGWGGPEERAGDAAPIPPGTGVARAIPVLAV